MASKLRIVGFGDSTTAGTPGFKSPVESPPRGAGDQESQYAYWMMREHPDWEVLNRGVNGERTDEILRRFERDVRPASPRIVVVLGGVNDIYQGYPMEFIEGNLASMYSSVGRIGATPIGCSVLPYNTMTPAQSMARRKLNEWIESECRLRGIQFCDTAGSVSAAGDRDKLAGSPDGLHPDVGGYRMMAGAIGLSVVKAIQA